MQAVDSIPQYRMIVAHAPIALRAVLSIGTARLVSCQVIYDKLCTAECGTCGDFGGYLYLVICERVCFSCFTDHPRFLPVSQENALLMFGLRRAHLEGVPTVKTVAGIYSKDRHRLKRRITLYDPFALRKVGISVHGSSIELDEYVSEVNEELRGQYWFEYDEYEAGRRTKKPRYARRWDREREIELGLLKESTDPKRFVAVVRAPFVNLAKTDPKEWGFHCIACQGHWGPSPINYRRKFTEESFRGHVEECGEIVNGRHASSTDLCSIICQCRNQPVQGVE